MTHVPLQLDCLPFIPYSTHMEQMKVIGKQSTLKKPGLQHLEAFLDLLDHARSVQIERPHGLFRFRTFEEAQHWWEQTRHPKTHEETTGDGDRQGAPVR